MLQFQVAQLCDMSSELWGSLEASNVAGVASPSGNGNQRVSAAALSRNSQAMPESSSARPPRLQSTFAQQQPQGNGVRAERGSGALPDTWDMGQSSHGAGRGGGFRVQCARPGCGAVMHVQPEQLGLEPVTLERVELEPVSRAEVLGSDPALLSETLGAPSFKQVSHA